MIVLRVERLEQFAADHADSRGPLAAWQETVEAAAWTKPTDVRETYGSADVAVSVASGQRVAVFNIKGNRYRLVASVNYTIGVVNVLKVMTHAEYSEDNWKEQL
jgi:mRNA interferase HigB